MAGVYYRDGGTTRTLTQITYGDAGTNRNITEIWYGDAGTNRKVWPPGTVLLTNHYLYASSVAPNPATATFSLNFTGNASGTVAPFGSGDGNYAPEWMITGPSSAYESRATVVSGSLTSGSTGVWQNLGTNRIWSKTKTTIGSLPCVLTIEIRDAATLVVLATATITLDPEPS